MKTRVVQATAVEDGSELTGTATVNPDCTGAITYDVVIGGQPAGQATFNFVILDKGRRLRGMAADPGFAVICDLVER